MSLQPSQALSGDALHNADAGTRTLPMQKQVQALSLRLLSQLLRWPPRGATCLVSSMVSP